MLMTIVEISISSRIPSSRSSSGIMPPAPYSSIANSRAFLRLHACCSVTSRGRLIVYTLPLLLADILIVAIEVRVLGWDRAALRFCLFFDNLGPTKNNFSRP
jgi:hypothetical protein